jgi:dTDP-4-amino-4,6-dideoxygalactose transaminase
VVLVESDQFTREDICTALQEDNIECRPLWKPMHLQPVFAGSPFYGDGTSENLFKNGLCLPSGSNLTGSQLHRVTDRIQFVTARLETA